MVEHGGAVCHRHALRVTRCKHNGPTFHRLNVEEDLRDIVESQGSS